MFDVIILLFCLHWHLCGATLQPDILAMSLPPDFQDYTYQSSISMDASATWIFSDGARETNSTFFELADGDFGIAHSFSNIPTGTSNFRIELEISVTYSTACEHVGLMIFHSGTIPVLSRFSSVNQITSSSGLMLFQKVCQYGTSRASFDSTVNITPTNVDNLGTTLETSCDRCSEATSRTNSATYLMVIQVVNQYLSVRFFLSL